MRLLLQSIPAPPAIPCPAEAGVAALAGLGFPLPFFTACLREKGCAPGPGRDPSARAAILRALLAAAPVRGASSQPSKSSAVPCAGIGRGRSLSSGSSHGGSSSGAGLPGSSLRRRVFRQGFCGFHNGMPEQPQGCWVCRCASRSPAFPAARPGPRRNFPFPRGSSGRAPAPRSTRGFVGVPEAALELREMPRHFSVSPGACRAACAESSAASSGETSGIAVESLTYAAMKRSRICRHRSVANVRRSPPDATKTSSGSPRRPRLPRAGIRPRRKSRRCPMCRAFPERAPS